MTKKLLLITLLLTACLALSFSAHAADDLQSSTVTTGSARKNDRLNVKPDTLSSNVFSFGVSLSGKTVEEALKTIEQTRKDALGVTLHATSADEDREWEATLEELGVKLEKVDYAKTLQDYLQTGSLLTRYKRAKDLEAEPLELSAELRVDEDAILEKVKEALADWNQEATEGTATMRNGEFEIIGGQFGHEYDFTEGVHDFVTALLSGETDAESYELKSVFTTVEPALSYKKLETFSVLGTCTTKYDKPYDEISSNREQNLVQSTTNMNGSIFQPGETISALKMYGSVTAAGGYRLAGTYTSTGHTDEYGGGICQTTSTLYNAVLLAELKVTYRRNHSYLVYYLEPSMDAMVYAPGGDASDFRFVNDSSDCIIIDAYVNKEENTLTVNIIGHEDHPETHSVRYESEILSVKAPEVRNIVDNDIPIGWQVGNKWEFVSSDIIIAPALKSRCWKITTDNGVETRTLVSEDNYKQGPNPSVYCAPDVVVKAEVVSSHNPGENFLLMNTYYVDSNETPIASDIKKMIAEGKMPAFNEEMQEKFPGYWTATGDEIQRAVKLSDPVEETTAEESETETTAEESETETTGEEETTGSGD